MYALVEDDNITRIINYPKALTIGDTQYPAKIFQLWSQSELNAIGIYEIVVDKTNYKDEEYYINTNSTYSFSDGQVTESWGTATARDLNDRNATDENGNDLDPVEVIDGLKTQKIKQVKAKASNLLSKHDWQVVKATEVSEYTVPSNVTTYRANVRTKSNEMETQINACSTVDELKALYEYTEQDDGTVTRPLAEFPEEI
jgi:hypothetical protein